MSEVNETDSFLVSMLNEDRLWDIWKTSFDRAYTRFFERAELDQGFHAGAKAVMKDRIKACTRMATEEADIVIEALDEAYSTFVKG